MVETACEKCGNLLKFGDDDVPPSGKVTKCPQCQQPVTVMPAGAAAMGFTAASGLAGIAPPKRQSPLAAAGAAGQKERRSPLAAAKPPRATPPAIPGSKVPNLPRPKAPGPGLTDLPAPVGRGGGLTDLPAPVGPGGGLTDLPAPVGPGGGLTDLPAPVGRGGGLTDLPAPVGPGGGLTDLPTPKADPVGLSDLPAPKASRGLPDLPTPKATHIGLSDLPAPTPGGVTDLPAPAKQLPDLMAPVGTRGDDPQLPAPVEGAPPAIDDFDISAPRDFFGDSGAPGGAPLDLGGFDLDTGGSAPAGPSPLELDGTGGDTIEPLDLGGLDPLPAGGPEPLDLGDPGGGLDLGEPGGGLEPLDLGGPGGLDLGGPGGGLDLGGPGGGLDLGEPGGGLDLGGPGGGLDIGGPGGGLDLGGPGGGLDIGGPGGGLDIGDGNAQAGGDSWGELELGGGDDLGLDLEKPSAKKKPASKGLSFSKPSDRAVERAQKAKKKKASETTGFAPSEPEDLALDLSGPGQKVRAKALRKSAKVVEKESEETRAERAAAKRRKTIILAGVGAFVLLLAGGGFFGFTKYQASAERARNLRENVEAGANALLDDTPGHWQRAGEAADKALAIEPQNADALGIAAQAAYAAIIDEGTKVDERRQNATKYIDVLNTTTARGPQVEKAQALRQIVEKQASAAANKLTNVAKEQQRDANVFLFLGWAHAASYNHKQAVVAFDRVLQLQKDRISAMYGRANALLASGESDAAREAFSAILKIDKNHFGALIGAAQLAKVERFEDREKRFLELLERPDITTVNPRDVARAWSLAGSQALLAGRTEEAGDRFAKALALDEDNISAIVGSARTEAQAGRFDNALSRLEKALGLDPNHLNGLLTRAEVFLQQGLIDDADEIITTLFDREPPMQGQENLSRAYMARGQIHESDPATYSDAEEDYKSAAENAGERDISATVALSRLYVKMDRGTDAVALLQPIESAAVDDPALAVTLGVAYLGSGDPTLGEKWFLTALEKRPDDVEAKFQLGLAMHALNRTEEGIVAVEEAYAASEEREDIGTRLALLYEAGKQDDKAYQLYEKLLNKGKAAVSMRARAGRFFARMGDVDRAREMGESILAEQPRHPAGLYLKGESLFAENKFADARDLFAGATAINPQPQFFEGLGRAYEGLGSLTDALNAYSRAVEGDPKFLKARLSRARIFVAQRLFPQALAELDEATAVAPNDPSIDFYRGSCYLSIKKYAEAQKSLSRSVKLDRNNGEAHYLLGSAYYYDDKPGPATGALAESARQAQGDEKWLPEAFRLLGYAHRAKGSKGGAIAAWRNYLDRAPPKDEEAKEVKRLLMRLEAQ